jgi:hypothetical protein
MQKTRQEDGTMWIMGPSSFRVIKIFESHMLSLSFSQNESGASTIQLPTFPTAKLEPIERNVLILFDFKDDIYPMMDFLTRHPFNRSTTQVPLNL